MVDLSFVYALLSKHFTWINFLEIVMLFGSWLFLSLINYVVRSFSFSSIDLRWCYRWLIFIHEDLLLLKDLIFLVININVVMVINYIYLFIISFISIKSIFVIIRVILLISLSPSCFIAANDLSMNLIFSKLNQSTDLVIKKLIRV